MEYQGELYGKVPGGYIPLEETAADVDALRARAEKAEAEAKQLREELSHSILEATAQLVNAKADALARAEKAEAALAEIVFAYPAENAMRDIALEAIADKGE